VNPEFDPIVLQDLEEDEVKVVAEFLEIVAEGEGS
jgi:hypothetical protein